MPPVGPARKEEDRRAISAPWHDAATEHDPTAVTRGLALDLEGFFAQHTAELEVPDPATLTVDPAALAWADREPEFAFASRDTVIGLIPARHGWEVPGLLSWSGAVNHDLDGAHHVAALRRWQERYGAELVTLTRDQIELLVAHPPRDPATMAQVAAELLGYCPDLDVRGTGMVAVLANEVVPHRCWSFGGTDPAIQHRPAAFRPERSREGQPATLGRGRRHRLSCHLYCRRRVLLKVSSRPAGKASSEFAKHKLRIPFLRRAPCRRRGPATRPWRFCRHARPPCSDGLADRRL